MPDLTDKVFGCTLLGLGLAGVATSGFSFFNLYENIKNHDDAMLKLVYDALNYGEGAVGAILLGGGIAALVHGYRVFYPKAEAVVQPKTIAAKPAAITQLAK